MRHKELRMLFPSHPKKPYLLLALLILGSLLFSGCITEATKGWARFCHNDYPIVERYGDFSGDQGTVSVSIRTLKICCYEPFGKSSLTFAKPKRTYKKRAPKTAKPAKLAADGEKSSTAAKAAADAKPKATKSAKPKSPKKESGEKKKD